MIFVETSQVKKMGKTPEDINNKLLKKTKKLEHLIKQLNEEFKKKVIKLLSLKVRNETNKEKTLK